MSNRQFDTRTETKPSLSRQPVRRREQGHVAETSIFPERDPLSRAISSAGNLLSATTHASMLNRVTAGRPSRAGQSLLQLQRQYGNRYVQRVLALARKGTGEAEAAPDVEQAIQRVRGGGQALDSGACTQMESAFGADFSGVRVHTDGEADTLNRELSARAFTTGQDIFFRQGAYNPGSSSGRELIAHELTHVVQQNGDKVQRKLTVGQPGDKYEQEADRVARAVMYQEQHAATQEAGQERLCRRPEEKEEELHMRAEASLVQAQAEKRKEEEGPIQTKMHDTQVQRQDEEEEKEEPVQTKAKDAWVQRQIEEEEPVQMSTDYSLVGRETNAITDDGVGGRYARIASDKVAGPVVQRDGPGEIEVETIDVPKKKGSVKDIVLDSLNTIQGIIVNFRGALENFETVVTQSSQEEAIPKATGLIVLDEISKFAMDKVFKLATEVVPGGKVASDLLSLGKSIGEAIEKEKKRAATASESNALKNFIIALRKKLTSAESNVLASKQDDAVSAQQKYDGLSTGKRQTYRSYQELNNSILTKQHSTFSVDALFTLIAERWINQSKAPGKKYAAQVAISLDKDWKVINAYINAPRGSRLAEELLKSGGGEIDLTALDVPKHVTWFPLSGQEGAGLVRCFAFVSAKGKITKVGAWTMGAPYLGKFLNLVTTKPIPKTVKLSGHKTQ